MVIIISPPLAGADKKAEAGAGAATEFQFVSIIAIFLSPTPKGIHEDINLFDPDLSTLQRGGFGRGRGQQPQ